jgi:hypothetical protein
VIGASLRLIRIAKLAALIADIWTIAYIGLISIWHVEGFLKTGKWLALPLSSLIFKPKHEHDGADITGSVGANYLDTLLQAPIILVLILAAALLTMFYLWLRDIERRSSRI